jgi:hypothetical protein
MHPTNGAMPILARSGHEIRSTLPTTTGTFPDPASADQGTLAPQDPACATAACNGLKPLIAVLVAAFTIRSAPEVALALGQCVEILESSGAVRCDTRRQ